MSKKITTNPWPIKQFNKWCWAVKQ